MTSTTQLDHQDGFDRERQFHEILGQATQDCPTIQAKTVKKIIARVAPDFMEGLFEARPCWRRLRYIGLETEDAPGSDADPFFRLGEEYQSIDFTGATYTIEGYGDRRIGFCHFERLT